MRIDAAYLAATHAGVLALLDDQIGYVEREAGWMHRLEHRLHPLGGALFTITALVCAGVLAIEAIGPLLHGAAHGERGLPLSVTVTAPRSPRSVPPSTASACKATSPAPLNATPR